MSNRTQFTLKIENFKLLEKKQIKFGHISKNGQSTKSVLYKVSDDGSDIFEKVSCQSQHGCSHQSSQSSKYLKEGMEVNVVSWNGKVLEVELPISVTLKVTETDPGVKVDTASGGTKPAILETGAQVMVPLFISVGEMIRVDTRNDSYLGREN